MRMHVCMHVLYVRTCIYHMMVHRKLRVHVPSYIRASDFHHLHAKHIQMSCEHTVTVTVTVRQIYYAPAYTLFLRFTSKQTQIYTKHKAYNTLNQAHIHVTATVPEVPNGYQRRHVHRRLQSSPKRQDPVDKRQTFKRRTFKYQKRRPNVCRYGTPKRRAAAVKRRNSQHQTFRARRHSVCSGGSLSGD
jgi:hypothetical protein